MTARTPRRRLSPEQRREQLMEAAVVVLARNGHRGASADLIAREAGVSKGLLWHYFDDRDDLLEATAARTLRVLQRVVGEAVDLTATTPDLVRAAVHAAADLDRTHPAERRALREIVSNLRSDDGSPRLTARDYDDLYAAQEEMFRRGQESGYVRADLDPRFLAVTYQGAVDGMLAYLDSHPGTDRTVHADQVVDVLLGGMVPRGDASL